MPQKYFLTKKKKQKKKKISFLNLAIFNTLFLNKSFVNAQIVHTRRNQLVPEFYWRHLILCLHNIDALNICMKKFDTKLWRFDKLTAFWTKAMFSCWLVLRVLRQCIHREINLYQTFWFSNVAILYDMCIGSAYADQLVPQLLLKQCDTFPTQYRHIAHLHEEVWLRKQYFLGKMPVLWS